MSHCHWHGGHPRTLHAPARICRTLLTSPDQLLGFFVEPAEAAPEAALLRERALATLGAMDLASLCLATDILDAIARRSGGGEQPP